MQYTGLDDADDEPIYEGDILDADDPEFQSPIPVEFERGSYWLGAQLLDDWNGIARVIGNIHQNPELLESEANE